MDRFEKSFTEQEPIPEEGIEAATALLRSGRLHRYDPGAGEVAALESEFAAFLGARHALAVASGGTAIRLALRALGAGPGTRVLLNAWTLAPVPGAVAALGATPILVETGEDLTIDLADLEAKAGGATILLLSHMRGHVADMPRLAALCRAHGLALVEDCAHSLGGTDAGLPSGRHGSVACYSAQSYKPLNAGEGGLVATDDPGLMARMVVLSGSYRHHARHAAGPPPDAYGDALGLPNVSGRMDELRAAILRPQLPRLPGRVAGWAARWAIVAAALDDLPCVRVAARRPGAVAASLQFRLPDWPAASIAALVAAAGRRGVPLAWFGGAPQGFTSTFRDWPFVPPQPLPRTERLLAGLLDLRLPLTFSEADCATVGRLLAEAVRETAPLTSAAAEDYAGG